MRASGAGRAAAGAAATGVWAAACSLLPQIAYRSLDEPLRTQALALFSVPARGVLRALGMPGADPWIGQAVLAFVLFAVASLVARALARALDRDGVSQQALRWTVRTWPMPVAWGAALAALTWGAAWLDARFALQGVLAALTPFAGLLTLPFFCLRASVLHADRPARLWRPGWPGSAALVAGLLGLGVVLAIGTVWGTVKGSDEARAPLGLLIVGQLAWWLLWGCASTVLVMPWVRRSSWRALPGDLRDALRPQRLRPALAAQVSAWWAITVLVMPLALIAVIDTTLVLPKLVELMKTIERPVPVPLAVWLKFGYSMNGLGGLAVSTAGLWLASAATARSLVLAR